MSNYLATMGWLGAIGLTAACGASQDPAAMDDAAGGPAGSAGTAGAAGDFNDASDSGDTAGTNRSGSETGEASRPFLAACASEDGRTDGAAEASSAADAADALMSRSCSADATTCAVPVDEHSFVRAAYFLTDGGGLTTGTVTYTPGAPGRFCFAGRVDPGPIPHGYAFMVVAVSNLSMSETDGGPDMGLDLATHRIAKFRFRIVQERPVTGIHVAALSLEGPGCQQPCRRFADFTSDVICPGTVTAAVADFTPKDSNKPLDPARFGGLFFDIETLPGLAFNFGFCIEDLAFLDADGREVTP